MHRKKVSKIVTTLSVLALSGADLALAQFTGEQPINQAAVTSNDFFKTITSIIKGIMSFAFLFSMIGFITAGFKFIISGGSEPTINSAHKIWQASLVTMIISLVGYVVIQIIIHYLG